ncbi:PPR domain-containing protein/PPR_2 domain-containing protein [Cephalotus follicularis]|uniref:PPR domain-containing protein/PPR_2 domain-containing protein n=1 Tax=Cephalotus follicularis TaxID=3775 RepID=A0A1Q3CJ06_CEPFO|nr:PPR domain-containing protein/PPR_2 domain-containing protein [Cephalotus follicularis]
MQMLPFLSQLLKPTKAKLLSTSSHCYCYCYCHCHIRIWRNFNSWALSIKNASSPHKALYLYSQMHRQSLPFDSFSILFTLKSCTHLHDNLFVIRHLHSHIFKLGFTAHVYVATSLLNAYVVSLFQDACLLFEEMPERNVVTWNIMITGYSKAGDTEKARLIFDEMPMRDVASWSAMIAGYITNGNWDHGLALFRDMMLKEMNLDQVTMGSVLSGCAHLGSLGLLVGKSVHGYMVKNGWELNVGIGMILIDMYAKCGYFRNACQVFDLMREKNVKTWTALICGSAQRGYSEETLSLFDMMQKAGVRPNEMTFTGILSACARTGLIEEGRKYFRMMEEYGLKPRIQHYGCMVDLFGKAGLLEEAYDVIRTMGLEPNVVVWSSFLSACKEHKQFDMAERVTEQVLRMIKPEKDGWVFSLISDLYVSNKKCDDAERVRKLMFSKCEKGQGL